MKQLRMLRRLLVSSAILGIPVTAQRTTNFTGTFTLVDSPEEDTRTFVRGFAGAGAVGTLGNGLLILNASQSLASDDKSGSGPISPTLLIRFNRLDRITISTNQNIPDPMPEVINVGARAAGGTGAYAGATSPNNALRLRLNRTGTSPLRYSLGLMGSASVGGQPIDLLINNVPIDETTTRVTIVDPPERGTCSIPPFGNGNFTATTRDQADFNEVELICAFSAADSLRFFLIFDLKTGEPRAGPITVTGGAGAFAGASGTAALTDLTEVGDMVIGTITGTISQAGPTTPIITAVNTAASLETISQNDWIEIKGTNLVPANTPAGGIFWSNAPEFAQGRMPAELSGISVTVNGKSAYVWWFCSAATTPACATDQINVLTPLDPYLGAVPVVVKNGSASSGAFMADKTAVTPSFLIFDIKGYGVATHADGALVGPAALFPGASTPARRGETISLWGVGFGLPGTPLAPGSSTQFGLLPSAPSCSLGGNAAQVAAALVSPGLYQFNVTVPDNTAAGEQHFYCTFAGDRTLGVLVAVQ